MNQRIWRKLLNIWESRREPFCGLVYPTRLRASRQKFCPDWISHQGGCGELVMGGMRTQRRGMIWLAVEADPEAEGYQSQSEAILGAQLPDRVRGDAGEYEQFGW